MSIRIHEIEFYTSFLEKTLPNDLVKNISVSNFFSKLVDGKIIHNLLMNTLPSDASYASSNANVDLWSQIYSLIKNRISSSFSIPKTKTLDTIVEICWLIIRKYYTDKVKLSENPFFISFLLKSMSTPDVLKLTPIQVLFLWTNWTLDRFGAPTLKYSSLNTFSLNQDLNMEILNSLSYFFIKSDEKFSIQLDSTKSISPRIFFIYLCDFFNLDCLRCAKMENMLELYDAAIYKVKNLEDQISYLQSKLPNATQIQTLLDDKVKETSLAFEAEKKKILSDFELIKEDYKTQIIDLVRAENELQIQALSSERELFFKTSLSMRNHLIFIISKLRNILEYDRELIKPLVNKLSLLGQDAKNEDIMQIVIELFEELTTRFDILRSKRGDA